MNAYQMVTQTILDKLSQGVVPWRKTWASGLPCSFGSGKEYRGINIVLLGLADHSSRYWVTFNEAKRLKGTIKKGSKGSKVVFWHWRTEEEREKLRLSGKAVSPAPCTPFIYSVFNLEATEGLTLPEDDLHVEKKEKLEEAEKMLGLFTSKPETQHGLHLQPCYIPSADVIHMPHISQFKSAGHYYSTLFHELIHSTGHASRLNRELSSFKDKLGAYSFEELVAEVGAAFLCAITGVENERTIDDQSSYIAHWQSFLQADSGAFMRACSEAQKAVDFIRGVEPQALKEAA